MLSMIAGAGAVSRGQITALVRRPSAAGWAQGLPRVREVDAPLDLDAFFARTQERARRRRRLKLGLGKTSSGASRSDEAGELEVLDALSPLILNTPGEKGVYERMAPTPPGNLHPEGAKFPKMLYYRNCGRARL
jgi:hypothetical protein